MVSSIERDVAWPVIGAVILFGGLTAGGLAYQSVLGGAAERLVTVMLIDAVIVLGIQIYVGNTGVLSFGHIGFGAIAGYTFAVLVIAPDEKAKRIPDAPFGLADVELSSTVSLAAAVVVTCGVALVVGIGLARSGAQSGAVSATVITLALLFVTHEVARNWTELTGGERAGLTFPIRGSLDTRAPIYAALLTALIAARLYARSRSGRLAVAAREDNLAARAMGVNPLVQQMAALLISVAVVSVGASLRVYEDGSLLPSKFFFSYTLLTLAMLIVGGRNSVTGAVLGVSVITAGRELARRLGQDGFEVFGLGLDGEPLDWIFRENLQTVFLGLAMLGFMIWRPAGLIDDWELDSWLRRQYRQRRIRRSGHRQGDEPSDAQTTEPTGGQDGRAGENMPAAEAGARSDENTPVERPDTHHARPSARDRIRNARRRAHSAHVVDSGEVTPDPLPEVAAAEESTLTAEGIEVAFGGFVALRDAAITARTGEVVGIIGPNGAGKTTFVNAVTSLVAPTSGTVTLDGDDVTRMATHQLARHGVVRTFQNLRLFNSLTVRENVAVSSLIAARHRRHRLIPDIDSVIAEAGLWDQRDRRAGQLDYGNSRRLELARATALAPSFLLLDEPTSGMSDSESLEMIEQVRHMAATVGAGVVVIDHDLGFITGISDRIYAFDQGTVIAVGTAAEIQADPTVQAAYLGSAAPA